MSLHHTVVSLLLASGLSAVSGAASAVTCSSSPATSALAGNVSPVLGCDVNTDSKVKVDSASNANALNLFGRNNWEFLSRDNTEDGLGSPDELVIPILMKIAGNAQSGTISVAKSTFDTYANLVLVLKAGGFVHYLLSPLATNVLSPAMLTWTYSTPFLNRNGTSQDISHFTVYGSKALPTTTPTTTPTGETSGTTGGTGAPSDGPFFGGETSGTTGGTAEPTTPATVPVPGSLALMGSALAGLGLLRRRRRA